MVGLDILHGYLVENFVILLDKKYEQHSSNCKIHVKGREFIRICLYFIL